MRHIVVGTAGHIDHGKSALVRALTGIDPDRLKEEKARGITIDLGFAHLEMEGVQIGFVDVPGHERFVKNMLAGVGGIDLVMLAVAADESIMPQTREHFDICRLLGIRAGIVVITKIDAAEPDLVQLVREEVEETVRGSFLEGAPIVPVSSRTSQGIDGLKQVLRELALSAPDRPADRALRLPVDRSFTIRGFGTVVTGTLISGSLRRDGEVELIPGNLLSKVRGLQVHGTATERALAGQRTAVNLQGIELSQVHRGMVLTQPGIYRATQLLDTRLSLLPSARLLRNLTKVRFHLGTAEVIARVSLLGQDSLSPGKSAYAQLRLDAPVFCLHHDAFIVRQFSPTVTIGGGRVLNPHAAKRRRNDRAALDLLRRLDSDEPSAVVRTLVEAHPDTAVPLSEIRSLVDWPLPELHRICAGFTATGDLTVIPAPSPILVPGPALAALEKEALAHVTAFHQQSPLARGMSREELRKRVFDRLPGEVFRFCLEDLSARRKLSLQEDVVGLFGREVQLSPEGSALKEKIEATFQRAGYLPPSLAELQTAVGAEPEEVRKLYFWMLKEKILIRISEELAYHRDTVEHIKIRIRERHSRGAKFGVADFKELFGLTRKHAIPLLEYLDRERFTRRVGNDRVLL